MGPALSTVAAPPASSTAASIRKRPVSVQLGVLVFATLGLILFILVMGDVRRKSAALTRGQAYADELSARIGANGVLPLELSPRVFADELSRTYRFEALGRDAAFRLRSAAAPVLAAWTAPIRQDVLSQSRAIVVFENGRFLARWVDEKTFQDHFQKQDEEIR